MTLGFTTWGSVTINPQQIAQATALQTAAAQDLSAKIRLVAVPGAGKSQSIKERLVRLLSQGVAPGSIRVVSFTNAATRDLQTGIQRYCTQHNVLAGLQVPVSTLHSLALRALRQCGVLAGLYPVSPTVLGEWELDEIYDPEFRKHHNDSPARLELIRRDYEGFCATGIYTPPMIVPPATPITANERAAFLSFHQHRSLLYACVLPGEIVKQCSDKMAAGTMDPVQALGIRVLIVDEYQDLNPIDVKFVDQLAALGADIFVCGDDDQSVYSFRFGTPDGIRQLPTRCPPVSQHQLNGCFRCAPEIANAAQALIQATAQPSRIPKTLNSLWVGAAPPVYGIVHRWKFASDKAEAKAIAETCRTLIAGGVPASEILILLSNEKSLRLALYPAFNTARVPYIPAKYDGFASTLAGKATQCLLRILCEPDDFVAYRTLLGFQNQCGIGRCDSIARKAVNNNLIYKNLFLQPLPNGVFTPTETASIQAVSTMLGGTVGWTDQDTIGQRTGAISTILSNAFGLPVATEWNQFATTIPALSSLEEVRGLLSASSEEDWAKLLGAVHTRLQLPAPVTPWQNSVRMMTLHSAKGLSARVVFIPGLEEDFMPSSHSAPHGQLVSEAARLLYVGMTRARTGLILSYSQGRFLNGQWRKRTASRFCVSTGAPFQFRNGGLNAAEATNVQNEVLAMPI